MTEILEKINFIRNEKGLKLTKMLHDLEMHPPTFYANFKNKSLKVTTLIKIANYLNVNPCDLLDVGNIESLKKFPKQQNKKFDLIDVLNIDFTSTNREANFNFFIANMDMLLCDMKEANKQRLNIERMQELIKSFAKKD